MDYKNILEHSFAIEKEIKECPSESRLEFLSEKIFNFTTYDSSMSELFGWRAVEVCEAITNGTTFDYISNPDNYKWFLIMCNMPFFADKLDWGSSIRGAWWSAYPGQQIEFQSCGLWNKNEQMDHVLKFDKDEWMIFIRALIEFSTQEIEYLNTLNLTCDSPQP